MRNQLKTLALAGLLLAPTVAMAQAPRGPGGTGAGPRGEMPASAVTHILNARRALDLTPRQVAQLDSMERSLWAERAKLRAQIRPQMQALRQRDSTTRVAAERLLTDAQRGKLREMQAERRGYERGRRDGGARGGMRGGMRPGMREGRPGWNQGRMQRGQRPGGRLGAPQGGARPPQRPE